MRSKLKIQKLAILTLIAVSVGLSASSAKAQYGTSFNYYNPRTGRSYSQQVYVGRGAAYGGFSYSRPGATYSAGSGYSKRNTYSHQFSASPKRVYGYQSSYRR